MSTYLKVAYATGIDDASSTFGISKRAYDEHGSRAPIANVAGQILPIPGGGPVAGGLTAAYEAPEGRGLSHGMYAGLGGLGGQIGGGLIGGLSGAALGGLLSGGSPGGFQGGGMLGGIAGGLYGGYKGTQQGQAAARKSDAAHAAKKALPEGGDKVNHKGKDEPGPAKDEKKEKKD